LFSRPQRWSTTTLRKPWTPNISKSGLCCKIYSLKKRSHSIWPLIK
jgi:hypothetical protein